MKGIRNCVIAEDQQDLTKMSLVIVAVLNTLFSRDVATEVAEHLMEHDGHGGLRTLQGFRTFVELVADALNTLGVYNTKPSAEVSSFLLMMDSGAYTAQAADDDNPIPRDKSDNLIQDDTRRLLCGDQDGKDKPYVIDNLSQLFDTRMPTRCIKKAALIQAREAKWQKHLNNPLKNKKQPRKTQKLVDTEEEEEEEAEEPEAKDFKSTRIVYKDYHF